MPSVEMPASPKIAPIVQIAPGHPDEALVRHAASVLSAGGVIAFPTDTLYGIGCEFGRPDAIARIQQMRGFDGAVRPLTFMLPDLGALPHWAEINANAYRVLDRVFPGPYCCEVTASPRVPSPFTNRERRTIGVRIPDSALCERLLWRLAKPILTATAKGRDGTQLVTALDIQREYGADLDLIIDGGPQSGPPSTVVSLVDDWVTVLREGRGPASRILTT